MNVPLKKVREQLFRIQSEQEFNEMCLNIFRYQYQNIPIYQHYTRSLRVKPESVTHYSRIPFLPIEFFKSHRVSSSEDGIAGLLFESSGTTGISTSTHYVPDPELYIQSFTKTFELFYGNPGEFLILALLPSYLERQHSSLVYMAEHLIQQSGHPDGGFFLKESGKMRDILKRSDRTVLLLGVSFALLDMQIDPEMVPENCIVMETGGMKGKRKEMVRMELHEHLKSKFNRSHIHSEYGMTELLSQAYSKGDGLFSTPPWMKVLVRDANDPLSTIGVNKTGGLNIIDLANIHSCSFIATQDLGRLHPDGRFEVLGRFDYSDIRGCNLMVG